jgi:hypothetical protein
MYIMDGPQSKEIEAARQHAAPVLPQEENTFGVHDG